MARTDESTGRAPVRMPALFSEAPMTLLKFTDVSLAYGAMPLLDGVS